MRITLADGSFVDCSTAIPLYINLYGYLQSCSSGVPETLYVVCYVLYYILPHLTSDVVLSMDWLHTINPWIDYNDYSLSIDCRY